MKKLILYMAQLFALIAWLIAMVALTGYAFNMPALHTWTHSSMAVNTAIGMAANSMAILILSRIITKGK
jgi:hypothetical protein